MNILVIKQTSLGDVLHATGHVRAIKAQYPDSRLVLLTATSSADIFRHSPHVDRMILIDRYRIKENWLRQPRWCYRHMRSVMNQVREEQFDIAFDLQGLAKSVVFLYGARAKKKFVKGHWPGMRGYRLKSMHALTEMDNVLALAGINVDDTRMEFATSAKGDRAVQTLLREINPQDRPLVILSPFSRWPSKDWPLAQFAAAAAMLAEDFLVVFTGAADRAADIDQLLLAANLPGAVNLAGKLPLTGFAALVKRAAAMLTGDSFPMHVAIACGTPVVALFGPTDDRRVGPREGAAEILRAPNCQRCDRRDCARGCMARIPADQAVLAVRELLGRATG